MIRTAVDMELFLENGIVCVHAHIYADKVADAQALEAELHACFKRWNEELRELGRLTLRADGTVMRDGVLRRGPTLHGKDRKRGRFTS